MRAGAGVWWCVAWLLPWLLATSWAQSASPSPAPESCSLRSNTSCDECLRIVTCLWCEASKQCIDYPVRNILPPRSVCLLKDARWGVCWVNFQVLMISMSVVGAALVIGLLLCCLCCCCRRRRAGQSREEAQLERQNRARNSRQKARRTEMQLRHDEIRQKYGLAKQNPYSRMDGK